MGKTSESEKALVEPTSGSTFNAQHPVSTDHNTQNALLVRMREYNAQLDRLMRTQFYSSTTPEQFLAEATKTVSQVLQVKRVSVWSYTDNKIGILCDCLLEGNQFSRNPELLLQKQDYPRYFEAISQYRVITAHQARTDHRTSEFTASYLNPLNIFSMLDAHVPSAAGVRGVLCCENVDAVRNWSLDEASFVASVAELIGLTFDRIERLKTQEQLACALKAAEKAGEAKSTFLATMSHEIRTPLNGVLGMLELALHDDTSQRHRQKLELAHKSARNLLDILGDVLDYSRLEAGEFNVENRPYSIIALTNDLAGFYRPQAETKGLNIELDINPATPHLVIGDESRVRQVLTNFLSNALKFTQKGKIKINVQPEQIDAQPYLRIEIIDSGIGIPNSAINSLFQRFSQIDSSTTRKYGGSGLGLAICKQMVELMGGEIGVSSQTNLGSAFWVRLPLTETKQVPPEDKTYPHQSIDPNPNKPTLKILAAEDNIVNQKVLRAMLDSIGHDITLVPNGSAAIEALTSQHFDVVLMDIQMPVMDGLAATNAIRALPGPVKNTTIIALTANAMAGDRERYLAAGMNGYIAKPLNRARLIEALEEVVEKTSAPNLPRTNHG